MPSAHHHDFLHVAHDRNAQRTLWVLYLSATTTVVEIAAGTWTGSMALVADGWHMATDTLAIAASVMAYRLAKRWASDPRFSFGTGKVGSLAGFASGLLLVAVAIGIIVESALRIAHPQAIEYGQAMIVAAIGLVINLASAALLGGGGHGHGHDHDHDHDHEHADHAAAGRPDADLHDDHNLRSTYLHVLSDAVTSVLAIIALGAGLLWGWRIFDPLMGVLGGVLIVRLSVKLIRDTGAVLLDRDPDPALSAELRRQIEAPDDAAVTDLHLWQVGPQRFAAIISVRTRLTAEAVRARLLTDPRLAHVTVECG
jgi:cation diffusion facilitator family transporter